MTIVDLPGQLDKATSQLNDAGFGGRFATQPINLLTEGNEFPEQADVIWMSQFLDCFSDDQIDQAKRVVQALRPLYPAGGR